jgi:hypothetical protein
MQSLANIDIDVELVKVTTSKLKGIFRPFPQVAGFMLVPVQFQRFPHVGREFVDLVFNDGE